MNRGWMAIAALASAGLVGLSAPGALAQRRPADLEALSLIRGL